MNGLHFEVLSCRPAAQSASPAVIFRVRVTSGAPLSQSGSTVRAIALRCQIQIEARARRYTPDDQQRLYELFGAPAQWDRTLRSVTWTQTSTLVPAFDSEIEVDLPAACTYDLHVAAANYLHGTRGEDVPLTFLFSGTVFRIAGESLQLEPISLESESTFRMPGDAWEKAIDRFYPQSGWMVVRRDTLDALQAFKGRQALLTWDDAMTMLLRCAEENAADDAVERAPA